MNRHFTTEDYKKSIKIIRDKYIDSSITTDIIVDFPMIQMRILMKLWIL